MGKDTNLHDEVRVAHATVNGKLSQSVARVLLHGLKNGLCLEASSLKGGAGNVAPLGIGGDAENGTAGIIDPVRGKEATKGRDEGAAAIVLDRLGEGAQLGRRVDEAEVVDEELDARARDGNAALQGVHGLAGAKVKGDGGQQAVAGDDGFGADVVEQEAARAVRVLGQTGGEALLADEGGRLVAQAAGNLGALEGRACEGAVCLWVRGADNLGQLDLGAVQSEPVEQLGVVVEALEVHKHGARGVGRVRDVDVAVGSAIELVGQPGVHGAKGQVAALVGGLDLGDVFNHPEELADRRVGG